MSVLQWSIWLANLDPVVGSEQGRTRPVLVISDGSLNEILPVVNVIPITSRKPNRRVYPNEAVLPTSSGGLTLDYAGRQILHGVRRLPQPEEEVRTVRPRG